MQRSGARGTRLGKPYLLDRRLLMGGTDSTDTRLGKLCLLDTGLLMGGRYQIVKGIGAQWVDADSGTKWPDESCMMTQLCS